MECTDALGLMIEDLDDLLASKDLLTIAVKPSQALLLARALATFVSTVTLKSSISAYFFAVFQSMSRAEAIVLIDSLRLIRLMASICSILSILLAPPRSGGVLWNMHSQSSAPNPIIRKLPYSIFLWKS